MIEELYIKEKDKMQYQCRAFYYTIRINKNTIDSYKYHTVCFDNNDKNNINELKSIEKTEGFMFWNMSEQGLKELKRYNLPEYLF